MKQKSRKTHKKKSIFRSLFIPLFFIMLAQSLIFYFASVYGGTENYLTQNAADILSERLIARKNEIETVFNNEWTDLDKCSREIGEKYKDYENSNGKMPFTESQSLSVSFLGDVSDILVDTLRSNEVNGIFLILNDKASKTEAIAGEEKYGICIRDMDEQSSYTGREDLLIERAPASIIEKLGCSLDSWWEAKYSFSSQEDGGYYYYPLSAAWDNSAAKGKSLAYCSGKRRLSKSDPPVISYSIPLISEDGYPYAVLGIELSEKRLSTMIPCGELNDSEKSCYVIAMKNTEAGEDTYIPLVSNGIMFDRCFSFYTPITVGSKTASGGFLQTGRGNTKIYCDISPFQIYDNNNPFEKNEVVLIAMVEYNTLFAYISQIKLTLLIVAFLSLLLGIAGLFYASRRFAYPITHLAEKVRKMETTSDFTLDRLGIDEIDQLVDSIEELNRNVSKNSARTEFFSRMSHDMRTPMNAIISFSSPELLEDADERLKDDYLEKINASGEYLLGLINEILDITKIESDKTEIKESAVLAKQLFDTTIPIIEKLAAKKDIDFTANISCTDGLCVNADTQHINQIVMNLLSNAVKFTDEKGKVALCVDFSKDESKAGYYLLTAVVSDNGKGMSEQFMKNIYEPFEQENNIGEGSGLGLSIAKSLAELMGGTIACTSVQGKGTVFTVKIPMRESTGTKFFDISATEKKTIKVSLKNKRILVCEDNALNTLIIVRLLQKQEATVETAENGLEGVNKFSSSDPGFYDAILMDIRMPILNGLEATAKIRSLEREDAKTIPIIAMTANAFDEDINASREAGMNAHLAKPVDIDKLYRTLSMYLS